MHVNKIIYFTYMIPQLNFASDRSTAPNGPHYPVCMRSIQPTLRTKRILLSSTTHPKVKSIKFRCPVTLVESDEARFEDLKFAQPFQCHINETDPCILLLLMMILKANQIIHKRLLGEFAHKSARKIELMVVEMVSFRP